MRYAAFLRCGAEAFGDQGIVQTRLPSGEFAEGESDERCWSEDPSRGAGAEPLQILTLELYICSILFWIWNGTSR